MRSLFKGNTFRALFQMTRPVQIYQLQQKPTFFFSKQKKDQKADKKSGQSDMVAAPKELDLSLFQNNLKEIEENFKIELQKIKRGRISADSLSNLSINIQGEKCDMQTLVQFIPKSANQINLNVYDDSNVDPILKILENSNMGLQLRKDGKMITCIQMGGNTIEMKKETITQIKKLHENYLQKLRTRRSQEVNNLKSIKDHAFKDQIFLAEKETQQIFLKSSESLDKLFKAKEKEVMSA